jgi:signal transduction histidine kinase
MDDAPLGVGRARSTICAPILMQKSLLGIIFTDTLVPEHRFIRDDLRLVAAIALQAGAALANAQLYERLVFEKNELAAAHQELKQAQDKLVQSEKLAAVGQLASGIVHDIKNPMTVILGYVSIMREKLETHYAEIMKKLELDSDLRNAEEGIHYCNEVINNLLKFAKPTSLSKATTNLNDVVQDTVKFLAAELNKLHVNVQITCAPDLPSIQADGNQLKQVFINIILNAAQAMDKEQPLIRIATEQVENATPPCVRVLISDNGKGMADDQRRRVFDPFFTTKTLTQGMGGAGLGMSISYTIINSHGGRIEVTSTPGEGSSFTVTLPVEGRTA